MSADVSIYLTPWCPYCRAAKQLLGDKKVRYVEIDVDDRPDLRKWLVTATGQRTVPQVFINGKSVGGYSDISALDAAGKLDPLLAEAPPAGAPALPR
jgi:glutaredoxin 3